MIRRIQKLKPLLPHIVLFGVSIGTIVAVILLLWWDINRSPVLPDSFSYSADGVASQTFYNPTTAKAEPPRYVKTNLEIALEPNSTEEQATLRSTIGSATVNGQTNLIHNNQRVNTTDGVYVSASTLTSDHVLAPRGIVRGASFLYRSPLFNTTAQMIYEDEETLGGLPVYRYSAQFPSETKYLRAAVNPDVSMTPNEQLKYTPTFQLWVEPTSGWIVKYRSEIDTQLINQTTKQLVRPYSHATETMSEESVLQHVAYSKTQKLKFLFAKQIVPSVLLTILLALLFIGFVIVIKRNKMSVYSAVGVVVVICISILVGWAMRAPPLMMVFVGPTNINPLTAICFLLVALSIVALYKNRKLAVTFVGGLVCVFTSLQILSILGALSFSLDLLFFGDAVLEMERAIPSHMSIYTAATLLLLGIGIVKAGLTTQKTKIHFARFIVAMVLAIGLLGVALKLTQFDALLTINFMEQFSIIPSLLFVVCAFTLLQLFRTLNEAPDSISHTLRTVRWPALATVPLVVIAAWTQFERNSVNQNIQHSFSSKIALFEKALDEKINTYESSLAGVRALYESSERVTESEFGHYVKEYISKQRTGITDFGFAPVKINGQAPIEFFETALPDVSSQKGYDLMSDVVLKDAMNYARDTGKTVMSKRTTSLQAFDAQEPRVFIIAPIYRNDTEASDALSRKQALEGFAFAIADVERLFSTLAPIYLDTIDSSTYDGVGVQSEAALYTKKAAMAEYIPRASETHTVFLLSRPWTMTYRTQLDFSIDPIKEALPSLIFFGANSLYFACLSLAYVLVRWRSQRQGSRRRVFDIRKKGE